MAKQIQLTQGQFAIVDNQDYKELAKHNWHCIKTGYASYAMRWPNVLMHRQILGLQYGDEKQTDHRNGNGLDNRRHNLRKCTRQQNNFNRRHNHNLTSSKYKGVCYYKRTQKWQASIHFNRKTIHLGTFEKETEAAKAYDEKAKELFGEFAYLNFRQNRKDRRKAGWLLCVENSLRKEKKYGTNNNAARCRAPSS